MCGMRGAVGWLVSGGMLGPSLGKGISGVRDKLATQNRERCGKQL